MASPRPVKLLTFGQAMDQVVLGARVRRQEWEDKDVFVFLANDILSIVNPEDRGPAQPKGVHALTVSIGDIMGEDWVVVKD